MTWRVSTSQSLRLVRSVVSARRPPGRKVTPQGKLWGPSNIPSDCWVSTSQSAQLMSRLPLRRRRPSRDTARQIIAPPWPRNWPCSAGRRIPQVDHLIRNDSGNCPTAVPDNSGRSCAGAPSSRAKPSQLPAGRYIPEAGRVTGHKEWRLSGAKAKSQTLLATPRCICRISATCSASPPSAAGGGGLGFTAGGGGGTTSGRGGNGVTTGGGGMMTRCGIGVVSGIVIGRVSGFV